MSFSLGETAHIWKLYVLVQHVSCNMMLSVTEVIHKRTAFQTTETWHSRDLAVGNLVSEDKLGITILNDWLVGFCMYTIHPGWVSSIGVLSTNIFDTSQVDHCQWCCWSTWCVANTSRTMCAFALFACVFLCYCVANKFHVFSCFFSLIFDYGNNPNIEISGIDTWLPAGGY